jgi:hypothetical protein
MPKRSTQDEQCPAETLPQNVQIQRSEISDVGMSAVNSVAAIRSSCSIGN